MDRLVNEIHCITRNFSGQLPFRQGQYTSYLGLIIHNFEVKIIGTWWEGCISWKI